MAELTPMMKQYFEIKEQHEDCILFFRLGDFYEMFYDDAKLASQELELTLTGRDCGQEERAPMCGVPFHSCESYIARLVARGYKVAICEQVEDPATAQGLVKRDVIRVITPGTVIEGSMLDEGKNNYLCVLFLCDGAADAGLCFTDCSTGEIHLTRIAGEDVALRVTNELGRFSPSEILLNDAAQREETIAAFLAERLGVKPQLGAAEGFDYNKAVERILAHFHKGSLEALGLEGMFSAVRALGETLFYLDSTQMTGLERVNNLDLYSDVQFMQLDLTARRNLELLETLRNKEKRGTLLWVLDHTRTAMGKRLIRSWIEQPLINPAQILRRLNAVDELVSDPMLRGDLIEYLRDIYDLERIMTRVVYGSANGRELRSLSQTIRRMDPIRERMAGVKAALLCETRDEIDPLSDVYGLIESAIVEDPPFSVREGGVIREGFHAEVDELRFEMSDGKGIIARIEAREKERTGIKGLKVGYNRVFGYYIEVSKSYTGEVPETYIRKQTLANAERYITQELKDLEARVLGAKDRVVALEYQLFNEVRLQVAGELHRIQATAQAIARLDVLCSFAETAQRNKYTRPLIDLKGEIRIKNGRHPVVEAIQDAPFVPNDTLLDGHENRVALITGPNMAGKSTFMRQTALIVLMAQIGSFVPADDATVGLVDSIFTRVGASDDLASGQSTFMVEMNEVASILKNATAKSLIVFDEIGRGTSTFDGMSIARAVLEYVVKKVGAKALFATHYHELTGMENEIDGVKNYNIAVKKRGDDITFLRRIVRGPADDSYGIEVAKLAGIPEAVVSRAKEILRGIESGELETGGRGEPAGERFESENGQLSLLPAGDSEVVRRLKELDVNTLTPIEAMQTLYELTKLANTY
ncbi:MAG TPA: DNA mismatch repair protein MutS [Firmicutes bacterium]|nr:DNA mismatch repair protein MutS [Bacillota bacterium]